MQNKSLEILLQEANNEIDRLSFEESLSIIIKDAVHIPRGLLEFSLIPNSPKNPIIINDDTYILVYCAGGYRSALAAKTLKDLGFKNVFNLGGYKEWVENGGDVQAS